MARLLPAYFHVKCLAGGLRYVRFWALCCFLPKPKKLNALLCLVSFTEKQYISCLTFPAVIDYFQEQTVPHCIAEHSSSIDGNKLLNAVFQGTLNSELFEADGSDIKARCIAYDQYMTGPEKTDFVHVQLRLLSGRTLEQKEAFSESVFKEVKGLNLGRCSITVEVIDIDTDSYSKCMG
nr:5-carboxymethyl-2-hydroxymuconate Delta-isomerase [Pseudoteredinibacter isoporae]